MNEGREKTQGEGGTGEAGAAGGQDPQEGYEGVLRSVRSALDDRRLEVESQLALYPIDADEKMTRWIRLSETVSRQLEWLLTGDPAAETYPRGM